MPNFLMTTWSRWIYTLPPTTLSRYGIIFILNQGHLHDLYMIHATLAAAVTIWHGYDALTLIAGDSLLALDEQLLSILSWWRHDMEMFLV